MQRTTVAAEDRPGVRWGWFLAWLAVGGAFALGLAALLSVGVILIVLAAAAAVFLLRRGPRTAVTGSLTGLALPLLYLAYSNRGGPGTVCATTAAAQTCTDEYAPVPFLAGGVLLSAAGVLLFVLLGRRSGRRARPAATR
ncbi:hypothetical protein [Streptomyces sp. NPDC006309]|uniref:hypothetical protein n=1 Tax=Streptomyces sp. NPDC006309 TaxID=3156749 RepID=UPI0033AD64BB